MFVYDEFQLSQDNGRAPSLSVLGSAPGENGVSVFRASFNGSAHFMAKPRRHLICFKISPRARLRCQMAGRTLWHDAPDGSLAILPAGIDCTAEAGDSIDTLLFSVDPSQLTLAAAEEEAIGSELLVRLSVLDDALLRCARTMASECAQGFPAGPLFWNDVASRFIYQVLNYHTSRPAGPTRATLGSHVLKRIRDYVLEHIDEPIEVAALAGIAARSPFHFSRVFTRSVGISPHRYVVHLRLRRAVELIRGGELSLAEIAVRTGFADQSHLSRWIRRVHGLSPSRLGG